MTGRFKPGPDKRRHRFTRQECRRGYLSALDTCMQDWDLLAWFTYKIRGYYRKEERDGQSEKPRQRRPPRLFG